MKTMQTLKAAVVVALGLGCAVAAFAISNANTAGAAAGTSNVAFSSTTNAAGEAMPVVTVTAKRLTATEKVVLAVRDVAHKTTGKHG